MRRGDGRSKRKWWVIVAIAVAFHLGLLLFVRPEFFHFLLRDIDGPSGARSFRASAAPDAIIAIQIDVEDAELETPAEPSEAVTPSPLPPLPGESAGAGEAARETIDLGELLGEAQRPREGGGSRVAEVVPPRPVEITWPETRRLKHCIGRHVDLRILVGVDGRIRAVEPTAEGVPDDCLEAALEAARRIKFTPGKVAGEPAQLWAQVRIDFEQKR